jgi:transcriptional regulator with XRE-family HTH domain
MVAGIGEKLRLERETRGIALRDISENTRISMRYLEAIETDDYRRLPGGIFNRSFIRAYAKFIGFDEEQAIEEYTRTLRDQGESSKTRRRKLFARWSTRMTAPRKSFTVEDADVGIIISGVAVAGDLGRLAVLPAQHRAAQPGRSPRDSTQREGGTARFFV